MATYIGPWSNGGRIEWYYEVPTPAVGATHINVTVNAYFTTEWNQQYINSGSKAWSGFWGSGTAHQAYALGNKGTVLLVQWPSQRVALGAGTRKVSFSARANHFFGSTVHTLTLVIPAARPVPVPSKPGKPTVARNSDTKHTVSLPHSGTWTGAVIQRQANDGGTQQVAAPGGNPGSWVDSGTKANGRYRYRVAGKNAGGQSAWSDWSNWVYTTPAAPTAVTATRSGTGIRVGMSMPAYATHLDIQDDGTNVVTALAKGSLPWTHANPNQAVPHKYRARARVASGSSNGSTLYSAYSGYSATVQLTAAPKAPTGLKPNGAVAAPGQQTLTWVHTPVDASEQERFELRYRLADEAWQTVTGTSAELARIDLEPGSYTWQVRTKGVHPDWSPWSAVATLTIVSVPGIAITAPEPGEWLQASVTVEWSFFQEEGRPQSAWRARLLQDGQPLEEHEGTGAKTSHTFATRLTDDTAYTIEVEGATGAIWSDTASIDLEVSFIPPAPGRIEGIWNEGTGAVDITLDVLEASGDRQVVNYAPRIDDVSPQTLARNMIAAPTPGPDDAWKSVVFGVNATRCGASREASALGGPNDRGYYMEALNSAGTGMMFFTMGAQGLSPMPLHSTWKYVAMSFSAVKAQEAASIVMRIEARWMLLSGGAIEKQTMSDATPPLRVGKNNLESDRYTLVLQRPDSMADGVMLSVMLQKPGGERVDTGTKAFLDALVFGYGTTENEARAKVAAYYDGNGMIPPTPGLISAWEDTPHASPSTLVANVVASYEQRGVIAVYEPGDDDPRVRLIHLATGAPGDMSMSPGTLPDGATVVGEIEVPEGYMPPGSTEHVSRIFVNPDGTTEPSVEPGRHEHRVYEPAQNGVIRWHSSGVAAADIFWRNLGIFEGNYTGDHFDGDTGWLTIDGEELFTRWQPDGTSIASPPAQATLVELERSTDGGITWVTVLEPSEPALMSFPDAQALSNGRTLYRVTTYAETGAATVREYETIADSDAIWLGAGPGYELTVRLPYNPAVSITPGIERSLKKYSGRQKPVLFTGEHTTYSIDSGGTILLEDPNNTTVDALENLALTAGVVLYRDPHPRAVYGALEGVSLEREPHGDYNFGFQLTETERE